MKKIFLSILTLCFAMSVLAQEEESVLTGKKGTPILPKAGDIAIGVEATPYLNYLGNILNGSSNNGLYLGSQSLYGRYFLSDNSAVRFSLTIDEKNSSDKYYVRDDNAFYQNPLSNDQVVDKYTTKNNLVRLAIGYQKFRGYGRLRGFYGAEVAIALSSNKNEYNYGNPLTDLNQNPTNVWNFGSSRPLTYKNSKTTGLAVNGIAGVEYYFAPKISIGGEIGLGISYEKQGQKSTEYEFWNDSNVEKRTELNSPGDSEFSISTYRPATYGGLYLMFHF